MKTIRNLLRLLIAMVALAFFPHESMATVEGRNCTAPPTDMVIQYGDVVAGPDCNLVAGDSGLFRFNGKAGERIIVVGSRAAGGNVCAELRGPDGLPTTAGVVQCGGPSIRIDELLTQDGTHTIRISEYGNDQALDYRTTLERIQPISPSASGIADAVITEEINAPSDLDPFVFNAEDGTVISVVAARTGGGNVCAELRGPDGQLTKNGAAKCGGPSIEIGETLTQGTHTIIVSEYGNDQTLNYTVKRVCFSGPKCTKIPPLPCKGDFDHDRDVDNVDAFQFRKEFGRKDCPL